MSTPSTEAAWSVRPEQPIDLDQIHELHRTAFNGPAEADLVDAIRRGPNFIPELSLVAVAPDESVLGHVLISRIAFASADADAERTDALALAPLAVLPPYWGRGIGSALVRLALGVADERAEPLVAVVGAPSYYARFGFLPAAELGVGGQYSDAGDAFQIRLVPGHSAPGEGSLIYPSMFEGL